MFPALLISLLLNLMATGYILFSYFYTNSREDSQLPQFFPQAYQDYPELNRIPQYGDKMDRWEDMAVAEDNLENRTGEQRFDNLYFQDVYYNLPRSL